MIDRRRLAKAGFWAGLLAAVFMALVMLLLRAFAGIPTLTELTSDRAVSFVPVPIFEFMIATFGSWAKRLLFVGLLILQLGLGGLLGAAYAARWGFGITKGLAWSHGILLSLILWAATVMIGLPALDAGFFGSGLRLGATVVSVGLALVLASYGLTLPWLIRWFAGTSEQAAMGVAEPGRRSFVRLAALGLVGVVVGGSLIRMLAEFARAGHFVTPASSKSPEGLPLEVTPNSEFYTVSKNSIDPIVDARNWTLEVSGLVQQPLTFTHEELKALPSVEQYATLTCISNP
ncbi:MAG: molybdopterin-dependent oxidoreductase, partial [Chloroflexi bacterium]|nr:molybdopterin-dependent oxidoreductase [Chloroflexota bacterium]